MTPRRLAALVLLPLSALLAGCGSGAGSAQEQAASAPAGPLVTVYKTPSCACCRKWVDHIEAAGFRVETVDMNDLSQIKAQHGVPQGLASCHTAVVEGYAVEGHVPADAIRRLLAERPKARGIAVPGMPMGSPGMEGPYKQDYEVYTYDDTGPTGIFSAH